MTPQAPTGSDRGPEADTDIIALLALGRDQDGAYIGGAPAHSTNSARAVFGGVLLGQAVAAATQASDRRLHMLSTTFIRGAAPGSPITYAVEAASDGGTFSHRRVVANQDGRAIADFSASLQVDETGLEFEESWSADPPDPESLAPLAEATASLVHLPRASIRAIQRERGLDVRLLHPEAIAEPGRHASIRFWVRTRAPLAERPQLWTPALAYISDYLMSGGGVIRHTFMNDPAFFGVTLNHTLWVHRHCDPSRWLLHELGSHWTGGGRTLNLGRMFDEDGRLVATTAQETLLRRRETKS